MNQLEIIRRCFIIGPMFDMNRGFIMKDDGQLNPGKKWLYKDRSWIKLHRCWETLTPFYFLTPGDIDKDLVQIKAAAAMLLKYLTRNSA